MSKFALVVLLLLGCLSAVTYGEQQDLAEVQVRRLLTEAGIPKPIQQFLRSGRLLDDGEDGEIGPCYEEDGSVDASCCYYDKEEYKNGCNVTDGKTFYPMKCEDWMEHCDDAYDDEGCSREINGTLEPGDRYKCVTEPPEPENVWLWVGLAIVAFIMFVSIDGEKKMEGKGTLSYRNFLMLTLSRSAPRSDDLCSFLNIDQSWSDLNVTSVTELLVQQNVSGVTELLVLQKCRRCP
jgi:hypothetical protein